jgi:hypothetical protein
MSFQEPTQQPETPVFAIRADPASVGVRLIALMTESRLRPSYWGIFDQYQNVV